MARQSERGPTGRPGRGAWLWTLAGVLAAGLGLVGCDNPACVFGGDCSKVAAGTALGTNPAAIPPDHAWILTGAPVVTDFFPAGNTINTETPVIVVFSESMSAQSLLASVALFPTTGSPVPVTTKPPALVADGRMLVVAPLAPLDADGTYELRYTPQSTVTDLTGTTLTQPADRVIGSFTVAGNDPVTPRLLTSWPQDGTKDQSATGEIVVVFDREVMEPGQAGTVNSQSLAIKEGTAVPSPNPPPQPVLLIGPNSFPTTDTRVWQYRKADGAGDAVPFPIGGTVNLDLSPSAHQILAKSGGALAATHADFTVASFTAPVAAELVSLPTDAIGIENLDGDAVRPLDLAVTLAGGLGTDRLGIFVFGRSPDTGNLIALFREVSVGSLTFDPMTQVATLTDADLDLVTSPNPVQARFADGELAIALRVERSGKLSPVRLVDVDPDVGGPQHALIDTTRPTFTAFGTSGNDKVNFASDLRNLAVHGRASEEIRSVEVASGASNNGSFPRVIGSDDSGLFVAAPLNLGLIDPAMLPLPFTMELYDRALNNTKATIAASFEQRGAVGPGAALPGNPTIDVEVFDARTLDPISGASIFVHEDNAGTVSLVDMGTTLASGRLTLTAAAADTVVTVEAPGYDIVTYHGVPVSRISLPMERNTQSPGTVLGTVSSTNTLLSSLDLAVVDTRQFPFDPPLAGTGCSFNVQTLSSECSYAPGAIRLGAPRVVSMAALDVPPSELSYAARTFLRGFAFELPFAPPSAGDTSTVDFRIDQLLDDPEAPVEEWAIDLLQPGGTTLADLSTVGLTGVDPMNLVGDPLVTVQARVRGMHGSALAGAGVALDPIGSPASQWTLRAAYPGIVDPISNPNPADQLGELVAEGIVDPDLFLRVEVRDAAGNRGGRRPRFPMPGIPASIVPFDAAQVTSPAAGGNTGGDGFPLVFEDRISTGGGGQTGIYRATLIDQAGRAWTLWRASGAGATRRISVPDLPAAGGIGLADGPLVCSVEAWAWTGFDETALLFSDIERDHDRFSESAPVGFTKP